MINEEHEKFHSRCHLLEKECNDINVALTRKADHNTQLIEAFKVHMKDSLEEITYTVQTHYKHLTDTDHSLDAKIAQKHQAISERLDGVQKHFEDVCLNLEFKLTEKDLEQDEKMNGLSDTQQEHLSHLSTIFSEMDKKLTADIDVQAQQIVQNHSEYQVAIIEVEQRLTTRMEHQYEHQTDISRGLANTITAKCTDLDERFTEQYATHAELVRTQYQTVTDAADQMNSKFDHKADEIRTTLVSSLEHLSTVCDGLEKRVTAKFDQCVLETSAVAHQNTGKLEQLDSALLKWMAETELMNEMIEKIDSRVNQHYTHQNDESTRIREELTLRLVLLEDQTAATDRAVMANHEHVTATCGELNVRITNKTEALEVQANGNRDSILDKRQTATTFLASLDKTAQEQHAHFVSLQEGLDRKFTEHVVALDKRVDYDHENFTAICARYPPTMIAYSCILAC